MAKRKGYKVVGEFLDTKEKRSLEASREKDLDKRRALREERRPEIDLRCASVDSRDRHSDYGERIDIIEQSAEGDTHVAIFSPTFHMWNNVIMVKGFACVIESHGEKFIDVFDVGQCPKKPIELTLISEGMLDDDGKWVE